MQTYRFTEAYSGNVKEGSHRILLHLKVVLDTYRFNKAYSGIVSVWDLWFASGQTYRFTKAYSGDVKG